MANSVHDTIDQAKRTFGDHLKSPELAFLRETQKYFRAVLEKEQAFETVAGIVAAKLSSFLNKMPSVRLRFAFDAQSFRDTFRDDSEHLSEPIGLLTEREATFSNDVIDAIEFVVCNGIGFGLIAGALSHDLNAIVSAGGLEASLINPKVSGWAKYNRALIAVAPDEDQ